MIPPLLFVIKISQKVLNPDSSQLTQGCIAIRPQPSLCMSDLDLFWLGLVDRVKLIGDWAAP